MSDIPAENVVATNSRIRAWWLITFRGYHVKTLRRQPIAGLLGGLRYECHWLLTPDRSKNQTGEHPRSTSAGVPKR